MSRQDSRDASPDLFEEFGIAQDAEGSGITVGMDGGKLDPNDPNFWEKHDKREHGGHFDPKAQRCSLREGMARAEKRKDEQEDIGEEEPNVGWMSEPAKSDAEEQDAGVAVATEWFKKNFNIEPFHAQAEEDLKYMGLSDYAYEIFRRGKPLTKGKYGEVLVRFYRVCKGLKDRFPNIKFGFDSIYPYDAAEQGVGGIASLDRRNGFGYVIIGDPERIFSSVGHVDGDRYDFILRHEIGHSLSSDNASKVFETLFNEDFVKKNGKGRLAATIGSFNDTIHEFLQFAHDDNWEVAKEELMADLFAMYTHPKYPQGGFPPEIEEFLEMMIKGSDIPPQNEILAMDEKSSENQEKLLEAPYFVHGMEEIPATHCPPMDSKRPYSLNFLENKWEFFDTEEERDEWEKRLAKDSRIKSMEYAKKWMAQQLPKMKAYWKRRKEEQESERESKTSEPAKDFETTSTGKVPVCVPAGARLIAKYGDKLFDHIPKFDWNESVRETSPDEQSKSIQEKDAAITGAEMADMFLEAVGMDGGEPEPNDPNFWEKHDKKHHHGHFDPETQRCSLREEEEQAEKAKDKDDDIGSGQPNVEGLKSPDKRGAEEEDGSAYWEKIDAEYMDAVEREDFEKCTEMVRQAAAKAMPGTKVVDKDGLPLVVYHGGKDNSFTVFEHGHSLENGAGAVNEYTDVEDVGFYFSPNKEYAAQYAGGKNPRAFFVDIKRPYVKNGNSDWDGRIDNWKSRKFLTEVMVRYPNQIKSADPVTYDDEGNVIPLSKRFQEDNPDIRFSKEGGATSAWDAKTRAEAEAAKEILEKCLYGTTVDFAEHEYRGDGGEESRASVVSPEMDAEYMDAVERGDLEKCAKLVQEAAAKAGYTQEAWHYGDLALENSSDYNIPSGETHYGTREAALDRLRNRADSGAHEWAGYKLFEKDGKWFWQFKSEFYNTEEEAMKDMTSGGPFATKEQAEDDMAKDYGGKLTKVYLNVDGARTVDEDDPELQKGEDIVRYRNAQEDPGSYSFKVADPTRVKSAAPVTYDDDGNVIPLSKRFDATNEDIRYSIGGIFTGAGADYANRSRQGGVDDGPSLKHIGTGEGSQVYGWGLYGSTERGVAESYANANKARVIINGKDETDNDEGDWKFHVVDALLDSNGDKKSAVEKIKRDIKSQQELIKRKKELGIPVGSYYETKIGDLDTALKFISSPDSDVKVTGAGNIYEQTFFTNRAPGDESHLLKWYEPVENAMLERIADAAVKSGIATRNGDTVTFGDTWEIDVGEDIPKEDMLLGHELYNTLSRTLGSPQAASKWLANNDIDGIKYPVDSYGGKGVKDGDEAGWNYVSFRDDNIRVDHKWVDGEQRYFKNSEGKVVGTYDRASGKITLYPGAKPKDVVHEFSHGLWQFAEQEAAAGRSTLMKKFRTIADSAPQAVKDAVKANYGTDNPNVYLEECFTHEMARQSEGNSAFARAIETPEGRPWYRRAWGVIKNTWNRFAASKKLANVDVSKMDRMDAAQSAKFILRQLAKGAYFGTVQHTGNGTRKSIIGVKGAERLGIGRRDEAERMEQSGASRKDIWQKTGWWKGKDGKWRVEIPSVEINEENLFSRKQKREKESEIRSLSERISRMHALLRRAEAKRDAIPRRNRTDLQKEEAKKLSTYIGKLWGEYVKLSDEKSGREFELDRLFDGEYDMPIADAVENVHIFTAFPELKEYKIRFRDLQDNYLGDSDTENKVITLDRRLIGQSKKAKAILNHEIQHAIQAAEGFARGGSDKMFHWKEDPENPDKLYVEIDGRQYESPMSAYRSLVGEVEARNAAKRAFFTPEEKASIPPWKSEDTPEENQIVRYHDKVDGIPDLFAEFGVTGDEAIAEPPPDLFEEFGIVEDESVDTAKHISRYHKHGLTKGCKCKYLKSGKLLMPHGQEVRNADFPKWAIRSIGYGTPADPLPEKPKGSNICWYDQWDGEWHEFKSWDELLHYVLSAYGFEKAHIEKIASSIPDAKWDAWTLWDMKGKYAFDDESTVLIIKEYSSLKGSAEKPETENPALKQHGEEELRELEAGEKEEKELTGEDMAQLFEDAYAIAEDGKVDNETAATVPDLFEEFGIVEHKENTPANKQKSVPDLFAEFGITKKEAGTKHDDESLLEMVVRVLEEEPDHPTPNPFPKRWAWKKNHESGNEVVTGDEMADMFLESVGLDGREPDPSDPDFWKKHDHIHHHDNFDPETQTCTLREKVNKAEEAKDKGDDIGMEQPNVAGMGAPKQRGAEQAQQQGIAKKIDNPQPATVPPSQVASKRIEGLSGKREKQYRELMAKKHPELDADMVLTEIGKIEDKKLQEDAFKWVLKGAVKLPEDMYKVEQARELATKAKKDPFSWNTPQSCINELLGQGHKVSLKPITIDELKKDPLFSDYRKLPEGVETFEVEDSREGQRRMREVIDTHWGKDANPWCLLARKTLEPWERSNTREDYEKSEEWWLSVTPQERKDIAGKIYKPDTSPDIIEDFVKADSIVDAEGAEDYYYKNIADPVDDLEQAWDYWNRYSALPKRVAFKNGKLLAFMATDHLDEDSAFNDAAYGGGSKLAEMYPDEYEEYERWEETDEGQEERANFFEWLQHNYPELTTDDALRGNAPEEWWDRDDASHRGIPIGSIHLKNGSLDRMIEAELSPSTGHVRYVGDSVSIKDGVKTTWFGASDKKRMEDYPDGTHKVWYPNGQLRLEEKSDGSMEAFHEDGRPLEKRGADGSKKVWHSNGQLQTERDSEGNQKTYDENGRLRLDEKDTPGAPYKLRKYDLEGQLVKEILPDSTEREFINGRIAKETRRDGATAVFGPNENKLWERLADNTFREFDPETGKLATETLPDGTWRRYSPEGKVLEEDHESR